MWFNIFGLRKIWIKYILNDQKSFKLVQQYMWFKHFLREKLLDHSLKVAAKGDEEGGRWLQCLKCNLGVISFWHQQHYYWINMYMFDRYLTLTINTTAIRKHTVKMQCQCHLKFTVHTGSTSTAIALASQNTSFHNCANTSQNPQSILLTYSKSVRQFAGYPCSFISCCVTCAEFCNAVPSPTPV